MPCMFDVKIIYTWHFLSEHKKELEIYPYGVYNGCE